MDTPTIAAYYREPEAMKRKALLDQSIAEGEDDEKNAIRRELWEIRYSQKVDTGVSERADAFLALWMAMEFNQNADKQWFAVKRARKEINKHLEKLRFAEISAKSELHRELLYRECCHLVKLYIELCEKDKSYNNMFCGLLTISSERVQEKLRKDVLQTGIRFPAAIQMENELDLIVKASREVYRSYFPEAGDAF